MTPGLYIMFVMHVVCLKSCVVVDYKKPYCGEIVGVLEQQPYVGD